VTEEKANEGFWYDSYVVIAKRWPWLWIVSDFTHASQQGNDTKRVACLLTSTEIASLFEDRLLEETPRLTQLQYR
jgi:hypothetical protein